jgi:hypothetical protein
MVVLVGAGDAVRLFTVCNGSMMMINIIIIMMMMVMMMMKMISGDLTDITILNTDYLTSGDDDDD